MFICYATGPVGSLPAALKLVTLLLRANVLMLSEQLEEEAAYFRLLFLLLRLEVSQLSTTQAEEAEPCMSESEP